MAKTNGVVKKMEGTNGQDWQEVNPGVFKWEKERDCLEGTLVQKRAKGGKYDNESYVIENSKGQHLVFGTTVLNNRMELVKEGEQVRITFEGTKENEKGQATKMFKVERKAA